jgi:hypothetical protein
MKLASIVLMLLLVPSLVNAQQPQVVREWLTVAPDSAGAEVLMPLAPTAGERTLEPVAGQKITVRSQISVLEEKHTFVFSFHDQPLPKTHRRQTRPSTALSKGLSPALLELWTKSALSGQAG